MELPDGRGVWNRACDIYGPRDLRVGDQHLRALLLVDGAVLSGGVGFACAVVNAEAFSAAVEASVYFGVEQLAELLRSIAAATPDDDEELQARYDAIDREQLIEGAFRRKLLHSPQDFEPL